MNRTYLYTAVYSHIPPSTPHPLPLSSSSELSRASKTRLSQHGFTHVMGDSLAGSRAMGPGAENVIARIPLPLRAPVDLGVEMSDSLQVCELIMLYPLYTLYTPSLPCLHLYTPIIHVYTSYIHHIYT